MIGAGRVLRRPLPCYEGHVPALLQCMVDHNICGMDMLAARPARERSGLTGVMFRHPMPVAPASVTRAGSDPGSQPDAGFWLRGRGWVELHSEEFQRQTRCELEGDVVAEALLNPDRVTHSAFTLTGESASEQRLVQSLATIWQQSHQDAGSQADPSLPKLGHILSTQPGSQSRSEVSPTDKELAMESHVNAMVQREESTGVPSVAPNVSPPARGGAASPSGGEAAPPISWTPFLDRMMTQALSQPLGSPRSQSPAATTADPPDRRNSTTDASAFTLPEARMSLEAGIGANSAAPTSSQTEMEELLDWMRNDEGQSASIAPQPVGERSEDQAMPAEESAADDEVDADGWTRSEREECENIMASQLQVDEDTRTHDQETQNSYGSVEIASPSLDGTDDRSLPPRRAKRSKNDKGQASTRKPSVRERTKGRNDTSLPDQGRRKSAPKRSASQPDRRGKDEQHPGKAKRRRKSTRQAVRRQDLGNIIETRSSSAQNSADATCPAESETIEGVDNAASLVGREVMMKIVGYGVHRGRITVRAPDGRFAVLFEEDGDTKHYTARRLRSCLVPTADSAVVSRAKKPPPVKECAAQAMDASKSNGKAVADPPPVLSKSSSQALKAGDWALVAPSAELVKVRSLDGTSGIDEAVVEHWVDEPEHLWFQNTHFFCPARPSGCIFVGLPPHGFESVRRHICDCASSQGLNAEPLPALEVGKLPCKCEDEPCRQRRKDSELSTETGCVWKVPIESLRPVQVSLQRRDQAGSSAGYEIAQLVKPDQTGDGGSGAACAGGSTRDDSDCGDSVRAAPTLSPETDSGAASQGDGFVSSSTTGDAGGGAEVDNDDPMEPMPLQLSERTEKIAADPEFIEAYAELVKHVPLQSRTEFRKELLGQLQRGHLSGDLSVAPPMIRDALNVVQSAFQNAQENPGRESVLSLSSSSSMPSFQPTLSETPRRRTAQLVLQPRQRPPSAAELSSYPVEHQQAHWADLADRRQFTFGGHTFAVPSTSVRGLNQFDSSAREAHHSDFEHITRARCITPAQRPPALEQLVTKPRKRRQRTETKQSTVDNAGREVLPPASQPGDSQASSAASFQEEQILTHSPKYDEGIGFSASASWTKRSGATPADRPTPGTSGTQAPEGPECLASANTHPSHSPDSNQRGPSPAIHPQAEEERRKSVQFSESPGSSVSSASGRPAGRRRSDVSQVSATTQQTQRMSQTGFKHEAARHALQHLVVFSVEVHVQTRAQLLPDPSVDSIGAICYVIRHETMQQNDSAGYRDVVGCIIHDPCGIASWSRPEWVVDRVGSESELVSTFVQSIHNWDPDIVVGFEIENGSIGFIIKRVKEMQRQKLLDPPVLDIESTLSRLAPSAAAELARQRERRNEQNEQGQLSTQYMINHSSPWSLVGRTCVNLWRVLRAELKLHVYTAENVALHVLHRHLPKFQHRTRTRWFSKPGLQYRAVAYCMARARLSLQVLDEMDLIGRTSELARVIGIDFSSVLWRGSQFRVESIMLRLAHSHDPPFLAISPTKQQIASQAALEAIPLVMEPSSQLYTNPVCVLDFRSLYPSVIIAYNLCYSTCLGACCPPPPPDSRHTQTTTHGHTYLSH